MPARAWITFVEAALRLQEPDPEWLRRVVEALVPSLDRGGGVYGWYQGDRRDGMVRYGAAAGRIRPEGEISLRELIGSATSSRRAGWAVLGRERPGLLRRHRARLEQAGIRDLLILRAPGRRGGCVVAVPLAPGDAVRRGEAAALARTVALLRTAVRLRRARLGPRSGEVEREALREAAHAVAGQRGAQPSDEAAGGWRALVSGRWPLVDHFERGGRRYLVVRRGAAAPESPSTLTPREREVLRSAAAGHPIKRIAWELGIAPSTVSMHLARAAQRLGVHSRVALIRAWSDHSSEG